MVEVSFEEECRLRFLSYCDLYHRAPFHVQKRRYAEAAYAQIDAYLDWREIEDL